MTLSARAMYHEFMCVCVFFLNPFLGEPRVCVPDSCGFCHFCGFRAMHQSSTEPLICGCPKPVKISLSFLSCRDYESPRNSKTGKKDRIQFKMHESWIILA